MLPRAAINDNGGQLVFDTPATETGNLPLFAFCTRLRLVPGVGGFYAYSLSILTLSIVVHRCISVKTSSPAPIACRPTPLSQDGGGRGRPDNAQSTRAAKPRVGAKSARPLRTGKNTTKPISGASFAFFQPNGSERSLSLQIGVRRLWAKEEQ